MRSRSERIALILLTTVLVAVPAVPVLAAETSNSEFVIIQEDDVFPDDLYAGAVRVVIEGTLEGDLVAFAGEDIVIDGIVEGSVFAVAPTVRVTGAVEGTVRAVANHVEVSGAITGDLVAAAVEIDLAPSSHISGDVLMWCWSAAALGVVGQDLTGSQRNLSLAGEIGGDVDVDVSRIRVTDELVVSGDLGYRSRNEIEALELAQVDGAVVEKTPLPPNLRIRALGLLGRLMILLFLSVAALLTALGWPERTKQAVEAVRRRPIANWLRGAALLFSPLLLIGITWLILVLAPATAAFPLLAVLVPLILAMFGLDFALALVAGVPVVGRLGQTMFRRLDLYASILAGSIVVGVLWFLPWIGWLVPLVVLPTGLGSWMRAFRSQAAPSTAS
jgi:cytoskeletal protein CcmA (bactofilin family)